MTRQATLPGGRLRPALWLAALAVAVPAATGAAPAPPAQEAPERILEQDPERNNLVTPAGYETGELGALGDVLVAGEGDTPMILVPGHGFGGAVFEPLMEGWEGRFRMFAVTLPGFAGTAAPPTPPEGTSFGEQTWTRGAVDAVSALIAEEDLEDVVLVGHWIGGTQVALELARRHPGAVSAVALLAGSARWVAPTPNPQVPDDRPLEQRVAAVDEFMAPRWFRTVTRETWDDNNFLPGDYAAHPVLGLRLWRQAARPPLHVWVRYLCEFNAQDSTLRLDEVDAPILLLRPGLEGIYHDPGSDYMTAYTHRSWGDSLDGREGARVRTIPDTRAVMWADRPDAVRAAVEEFLEALPS